MLIRGASRPLEPAEERAIGKLDREQSEILREKRHKVAAAKSDKGQYPWETEQQYQDRLAGGRVYTTEDAEHSTAAARQDEVKAQEMERSRKLSGLLGNIKDS